MSRDGGSAGPEARGPRPGLKDQEPFATFRAEPRRFWIGLPMVFIGGAIVGAVLSSRSLQWALAIQLVLQTGGFLWLYIPALRRHRGRPEGHTPPE